MEKWVVDPGITGLLTTSTSMKGIAYVLSPFCHSLLHIYACISITLGHN